MTNNNRGFPKVAEPPWIESIVPVAMVRTALTEEPTVFEVVVQSILDQKSLTVS